MKVTCIPDKVSDGKSIKQLIPSIVEDERTPGLDTPAITEFVKQRRRDAVRITELALRAIEALEKPGSDINTFYEKSAVNGFRD
jgi:hypothetical protein